MSDKIVFWSCALIVLVALAGSACESADSHFSSDDDGSGDTDTDSDADTDTETGATETGSDTGATDCSTTGCPPGYHCEECRGTGGPVWLCIANGSSC